MIIEKNNCVPRFLLQQLFCFCEAACKYSVEILLAQNATQQITYIRLVVYYKRFGFLKGAIRHGQSVTIKDMGITLHIVYQRNFSAK